MSAIRARAGRGDGAGERGGPFEEEAYRVIRSNLQVSLSGFERPRVVVTSANPGEGKTVTCANLAVSFARAGLRVVLLDLDLRHPDAHRLVGAHNRFGASGLLLGTKTLEECLQYVALPAADAQSAQGLYFVGTGPQVRNPTELLGMSRTALILDELGKQADLVLIDAPPVLPVADTLVIGPVVTGALVVVEARHTSTVDLSKTTDLLTRHHTPVLGVVLNKLQPRDRSHGDTYGYGTTVVDESPYQGPRGTKPDKNGNAPSGAEEDQSNKVR